MGNAPAPPSLEDAYRRYFPAIREKCRRMLGDAEEAQDVAQETFVRLWRSGPTAVDGPQVLGWAYRTSTRLAIDRLRRRALQTHEATTALQPEAPSSVDAVLDARSQLESMATRLPQDDLELLILERIDGLSQPETARLLGTSERTIRRRAARAHARLERLQAELRT